MDAPDSPKVRPTLANMPIANIILPAIFILIVCDVTAHSLILFIEQEEAGLTHGQMHKLVTAAAFVIGAALALLLLAKHRLLRRTEAQKISVVGALNARIKAMDTAVEGMALTDADGTISYVNRAMAGFFRCQPEEMTGRRWADFYPAAQVEWLESEILPQLEETAHWSGHSIGKRADDSTFFQELSLSRLADGGLLFIVRDFTEARRAAELSSRRLAAIEAAGEGIGLLDPDGKVTYINSAFMKLLGMETDRLPEFIGSRWTRFYAGADIGMLKREAIPVLARQGSWKGEIEYRTTDGRVIDIELMVTLLPDNGAIATARDIGDRIAAQREKEALQRQIYQTQKMDAVGRLAGGIAHDFNNLLASITGYAEFLLKDLPAGSETHGFASQIMQGCRQARHLIEQVLAFSRMRETTKEPVNLADIIEETVSMLRSTLPASIELACTIKDGNKPCIEANGVQISQTIMNLCVNARDAMDEQHGRLAVTLDRVQGGNPPYPEMLDEQDSGQSNLPKIVIRSNRDGGHLLLHGSISRDKDYARVTVADSGAGMSREVMERIFEPFFTTKPPDHGTGLGLSTVHGIVSGHDGAMTVESIEGRGTIFSIYFPTARCAAPDAVTAAPQAPLAKGKARIFLVEDQQHVRDMMSRMLTRLGYAVGTAASGDDAIDLLRENPGDWDLVLSDQSMPRMSGSELAAQIREDFPDLPVILITGYSVERLRPLMRDNPSIRGILTKPVESSALFDAIEQALQAVQNG